MAQGNGLRALVNGSPAFERLAAALKVSDVSAYGTDLVLVEESVFVHPNQRS